MPTPDITWLQVVTSFMAMGVLTIFAVLVLVGWIYTKRQHDAEIQIYRDQLASVEAARAAEYNRMDREYARMVNAKDLAIDQAERYAERWRAAAREAMMLQDVTGQRAVEAVEAVASKLPPSPDGTG